MQKPIRTQFVHLIYARENGRLHLTGYGYGHYIASATPRTGTIFSVNCIEEKWGENDYRYTNKETTVSTWAGYSHDKTYK